MGKARTSRQARQGMHQPLRTGLSLLLGAMLAVTLIPAVPSWAAEKGDGAEKENVVAAGSVDAAVYEALAAGTKKASPFAYEEGQSLKAQAAYPSAFDLRNVNGKSYVTPVRLQNPFGTCWGFAATATAESAILADEALGKDLDADTFDLSEKHLAWFAETHIDDTSSPQNGEGVYFYDDDGQAATHYNTGGLMRFGTLCYAAGMGPMPEVWIPYQGANGDTARWRVATSYDADGNPTSYAYKDVWYSEEDDWTLDESLRYGNQYQLKDSFILPSPANRTQNETTGETTYTYDPDGVTAVKEQMYDKHRAVSVSFTAESYMPGQDTSGKLYMSSNWAHYTWKPESANHAVTIVGWDDNYPKENFLADHQPPGDGAFLIKNSWGSELNVFPNNGYRHWGLLEGQDGIPYDAGAKAVSDRATGYFWISYYDQSLGNLEAFDFDKANDGDGYYVEQHDLMITGDIGEADAENVKTANAFQAEATSELSAISVMTTTPGTTVDYEIYLLRDGYTGPTDGIKLTQGSASFDYGGYHRIDLASSQRAVLAKGQSYSVIVTEKTPAGKFYFPVSMGNTEQNGLAEMQGFYNKSVINKGESYLYAGGKWADLSDTKLQQSIIQDTGGDFCMDNFLIKSYLDPVTDDGSVFSGYLRIRNWSQGTPGNFSFEYGTPNSLTLIAEFRGSKAGDPEITADEITWTSSDENIFTVTPDKNNSAQAVIATQADQIGMAYLTVDAGSYGKRVVGVVTGEPYVMGTNVRGLKVKKGRKLTVSLLGMSEMGVNQYQVRYRVKGKSAWKTKKVSSKKTVLTLKGLKKGKKYQVQARCVMKVNGLTLYSEWSDTKTSKKIK